MRLKLSKASMHLVICYFALQGSWNKENKLSEFCHSQKCYQKDRKKLFFLVSIWLKLYTHFSIRLVHCVTSRARTLHAPFTGIFIIEPTTILALKICMPEINDCHAFYFFLQLLRYEDVTSYDHQFRFWCDGWQKCDWLYIEYCIFFYSFYTKKNPLIVQFFLKKKQTLLSHHFWPATKLITSKINVNTLKVIALKKIHPIQFIDVIMYIYCVYFCTCLFWLKFLRCMPLFI